MAKFTLSRRSRMVYDRRGRGLWIMAARGKQVIIAKLIDALTRIAFGGEPTQEVTTISKLRR